MDYSKLFQELQDATLFDLYRIQVGIDKMLDQPERLQAVKNRLRPGMEIVYFDEGNNHPVRGEVVELRRTRLVVRSLEDNKQWLIRFHMIDLDGVDTSIHTSQKPDKLDRNQLSVGDRIGFYDRKRQEHYGKILRLNQKSVTILTKAGTRWRVAYALLFRVMDGETTRNQQTTPSENRQIEGLGGLFEGAEEVLEGEVIFEEVGADAKLVTR
ncbi:MAG: hypothetical protein HQL52_14065 [Magnetococcales bacterium]|nr:hypothetical protein [Magnetococcales bacterium]